MENTMTWNEGNMLPKAGKGRIRESKDPKPLLDSLMRNELCLRHGALKDFNEGDVVYLAWENLEQFQFVTYRPNLFKDEKDALDFISVEGVVVRCTLEYKMEEEDRTWDYAGITGAEIVKAPEVVLNDPCDYQEALWVEGFEKKKDYTGTTCYQYKGDKVFDMLRAYFDAMHYEEKNIPFSMIGDTIHFYTHDDTFTLTIWNSLVNWGELTIYRSAELDEVKLACNGYEIKVQLKPELYL